jgi:hypothetical protein
VKNPPHENCVIASPAEIQKFGAETLGWSSSFGTGIWAGAYKDFSDLVDITTGDKLPADPVKGWKNLDGTPWHVTSDTVGDFWRLCEPNNGGVDDKTNPVEQYISLTEGKMSDRSNDVSMDSLTAGAIYKCCSNTCRSGKSEQMMVT